MTKFLKSKKIKIDSSKETIIALEGTGLKYLMNNYSQGVISKINIGSIKKLNQDFVDERPLVITVNTLRVYDTSEYQFISIFLNRTPIGTIFHSCPERKILSENINLNFLKSNKYADYDIVLRLSPKELAELKEKNQITIK